MDSISISKTSEKKKKLLIYLFELAFCLVCNISCVNGSEPILTNQFVIEIQGGPQFAKRLSEENGFVFLGHVSVIIWI